MITLPVAGRRYHPSNRRRGQRTADAAVTVPMPTMAATRWFAPDAMPNDDGEDHERRVLRSCWSRRPSASLSNCLSSFCS
jgi:hypothetical protein